MPYTFIAPYLPCDTESAVERAVERETNRIDSIFMAEGMTQSEYDNALERLADWADNQYAKFADL